MKLVEFLAPLETSSCRNQALAVLSFFKRYEGGGEVTAEDVKARLQRARVPKAARINVTDVLAKAGALTDSPGKSENGRLLWELTDTGLGCVRDLLDLPLADPEVEHDVGSLTSLMPKIRDELVRNYMDTDGWARCGR